MWLIKTSYRLTQQTPVWFLPLTVVRSHSWVCDIAAVAMEMTALSATPLAMTWQKGYQEADGLWRETEPLSKHK